MLEDQNKEIPNINNGGNAVELQPRGNTASTKKVQLLTGIYRRYQQEHRIHIIPQFEEEKGKQAVLKSGTNSSEVGKTHVQISTDPEGPKKEISYLS